MFSSTPLSNTQLELLRVFTHDLSEDDLTSLRRLLARFFAERLVEEADKIWDEKKWDEADVERMLHTKMRKR